MEVTATKSIANLSDNQSIGPCIGKGSGVLETCMKEAMMCDMSPLGFHLTLNMKEKIWKHEFINILSLLPSAKESVKNDKKSDGDRKRIGCKPFLFMLQC